MHNALFDVVMPALSPNGWKVFCFIIRKTIGYQKSSDLVSYSQIIKGCGIVSRSTVSAALKELVELRAIVSSDGEKYEAIRYRVNRRFEVVASPEIELGPSPEIGLEASPKNGLPLVQKLDTQKTSTKNNRKDSKSTPDGDAPDFAIAQEIATVCDMAFAVKSVKARCFKAAKDLSPLMPTVAQVNHFNRWARLNWWRCTKSNQLYPEDFAANWQQALAWNGTVRMANARPSVDVEYLAELARRMESAQ
jgi:phage replication O-like protein O